MMNEIVFAAGCFWGVEKYFGNIDGVLDVKSGYAGGNYKNPTYDDLLKYRYLELNNKIINHTESVKVIYDDTQISTEKLIKSFWELHNPTQLNQQGNDIGNNYRSALFFTNQNQKDIALDTREKYQILLTENGYGKIVTQIEPLDIFWIAENYHQNYLKNNPNGYCPNHSTGVKFDNDDIDSKEYYRELGIKIFGKNTHSFNVAFNQATDHKYCDEYEKFKDTPDGVFVDKLSKEVLFDTKDRFDSGSGWLSFYKAAPNSIIEKIDLSYGMKRVEVVAKKSGIHLGHVFDEFNRRRFCINASVLDFIPR